FNAPRMQLSSASIFINYKNMNSFLLCYYFMIFLSTKLFINCIFICPVPILFDDLENEFSTLFNTELILSIFLFVLLFHIVFFIYINYKYINSFLLCYYFMIFLSTNLFINCIFIWPVPILYDDIEKEFSTLFNTELSLSIL